jgi:hypothetical protein
MKLSSGCHSGSSGLLSDSFAPANPPGRTGARIFLFEGLPTRFTCGNDELGLTCDFDVTVGALPIKLTILPGFGYSEENCK